MPQEIYSETDLREPFTVQAGLDEYMVEQGLRGSDPVQAIGTISVGGYVFGEHRKTTGDSWLATLDPDTNLHEVLFLMGISEAEADRAKRVFALLDEATDRAIDCGDGTIGDLLASGTPNLYEQLFHEEISD